MEIHCFDTLESTNNYCKLLDPNTVGEFTVICAHTQTAGIGQQGNVWVSEPHKNLTFSVILKPTFIPTAGQYQLTMALSLAIAETVDTALSTFNIQHSTFIKWPNDIYVNDKKICGTLITNQISGNHISQSICGIGLNVNQTKFPDWVPNPTSMQLLTGQEYNLETILHTLLSNLEGEYNNLKDNNSDLESRYLSRLYRLGIPSKFIYNSQTIIATITGINHFGHLQLITDTGKHLSCDLKEIKYII